MKKMFLFTFISIMSLFIVGCGTYGEKDVIKDLSKKVDKSNGYMLSGELEILNNDEVYTYNVEVSYKKDNLYKVSLTNKANNHTQVILKNEDGVYVLTPSLNKSFKFQSDWPYSNSQIYLLQAIINDIEEDDNREFKVLKNGYQFITTVNYPNNRNLTTQKIQLDKKLNIENIKVYNNDKVVCMEMEFDKINYSKTYKDSYFELDTVMKSYSLIEEEIEETSSLDDSIYPLVVPDGTRLTSEEKVNKSDGERIIMTFDGEKPFLLVEETVTIEDEFTVIPTYGEPYRLMDTLGVMTDNSLTWVTNGIEYYIVSDVLSQDEMLEVASSINILPTMK